MAFLGRSDEVLTVGEFTRRFKMLLKTSIPELWISGEVSNLRVNSSGHSYFTLKDADASISAVLFRGNARSVSFPLRDGAKIFAFGEISIYEPKGTYQIIVRAAIPDGSGDLAARFEALKDKLSKEGLFDKSSKKKIPAMPKNVAVITSPTGAAMRDFHRILKRRGWRGNIWVLPARVQGAEAAAEIASQIEFAKNFRFEDGSRFDVLVLTRGGGSLEDLWSFNEEIVARAVAGCDIPTISAVGHEIDFTLCDFAADLRAETPSAAAEYISSAFVEMSSQMRGAFEGVSRRVEFALSSLAGRLDSCAERLRLSSPSNLMASRAIRLDELSARLSSRASESVARAAARLSGFSERLAAVSPLQRIGILRGRAEALGKQLEILGVESTLGRGFAVAVGADGSQITASSIKAGEGFSLRFADGKVSARAESVSRED